MTDINVTVNSPTVEVIELSITEDVASSTLVTVATPTVQQINVSVADQTPEVVNVTVSDPSPEIVQVDVWESGQSGPGIIAGGLTGQIITKQSDLDFDVEWSQSPYDYTTNAIATHVLQSNPHPQYLLLTGGLITGGLEVTGVPSTSIDVVRKLELDSHIANETDAHEAVGVLYSPPATGPVSLWLNSQNVQGALTEISAQLYAPDEEAMEAMIAAANALVGGTGQEFDNPDLFASELIVTRHMLAGSIDAAVLTATTIKAALIAGDSLESNNYAYSGGAYSTAGTFFDLTNGNLISEEFSIIGGAASISDSVVVGSVTASDIASQTYASSLADAAQAAANTYTDAAEAQAVITANAYADGEVTAAEAAAIAAAAADATAKADAAQTAATDAANAWSAAYVQSRGENLITNGTGLTGDNLNFTDFDYDASDVRSGAGAFVSESPSGAFITRDIDEIVPIDPTKPYQFSYWIKQLYQAEPTDEKRVYGHTIAYDATGASIAAYDVMKFPGSKFTSLALPLNPGDTTITLNDATGWSSTGLSHTRFISFQYTDGRGYTYPAYTYSKHCSYPLTSDFTRSTDNGTWESGALVGNVITLPAPYSGPIIPAGTKCWNSQSGGSFDYIAGANTLVPYDGEWHQMSGIQGGGELLDPPAEGDLAVSVDSGMSTGINGWYSFRWGTAFVKVGWLAHRGDTGNEDHQSFSDIQFSQLALKYGGAADDVNLNTTTISGGKITTGSIEALQIAAGAITTDKMTVNTIAGDRIAVGTLDADRITANSIEAGQISANTITASEIDTPSISTAILTADSITSAMIDVTDLSAINANLGIITGGSLDIGSGTFVVDSSGNLTATSATISGTLKGSEFELYDTVPGSEVLQSEWQSVADPYDVGEVNNSLLFWHNNVGVGGSPSGFYWDSDGTGVTWVAGAAAGTGASPRLTQLVMADGSFRLTNDVYELELEDTYARLANQSGTRGIVVNNTYGLIVSGNADFDNNITASGDITSSGFVYSDDRLRARQPGELTQYTDLRTDGSWGRLDTTRDRYYINKEIRVDSGYVGSYNESLLLADSGIVVGIVNNAADAHNFTIYEDSSDASGSGGTGIRIYTRGAASAADGGTAGMLWQTRYSTDRHVHARVYYSGGDQLGFRNYENTAWVSLKASAFTVGSDAKYKNRIRKGRDEHHPLLEAVLTEDRQLAFDNHKAVDTIIYDDSELETLWEWAGCPGKVPRPPLDDGNTEIQHYPRATEYHDTRQECVEAACPGQDNMVHKDHHCDDYECGGTNESPCWLIEKHVDRPGFLAQNVEMYYPKVVDTDFNNEEKGIDLYGLIAELWNTVDHLIDECEDLRAALNETMPGNKKVQDRPRGGTILPPAVVERGKRSDRIN